MNGRPPDRPVPGAWLLLDALDDLARQHGWRPAACMVSGHEVTVTYVKDPIIALIEALPEE